jgi:hypothetical protein
MLKHLFCGKSYAGRGKKTAAQQKTGFSPAWPVGATNFRSKFWIFYEKQEAGNVKQKSEDRSQNTE